MPYELLRNTCKRKDACILGSMGKKESEAAAALGRARWKDVPPEERIAHSGMMLEERWKDKTPQERSAAASAAAKARWEKAKKKARKADKKA